MCTKVFLKPEIDTRDYFSQILIFERGHLRLYSSYFPDYFLIIRTDASVCGLGAVLIQVPPGSNECIALWENGLTWLKGGDIEKKEAAMFCIQNVHLLTGKFVIIETDNKNLLFMETATWP
jgi:hypothetical protein